MKVTDRADFDFLRASALAGQALGLTYFRHLDQPIGAWNYIRIANDIARRTAPGRLLDWGCGLGQMTYLLRRRGFTVTPFDVGAPDRTLPDIPLCRGIDVVRAQERTLLPFESGSFDAVISCGVLEHVDEGGTRGDELKSLAELARVLRTGGHFLIYQLPQRYAWQEAIIRRYKLGYAHPRRYTADEIGAMLAGAGFRVQHLGRADLVPKNLSGMPARLRTAYSRLSRPLIAVDGALCHIPLLNRFAGVMEIQALKG
jgi:SAM-dependent methyltransferase